MCEKLNMTPSVWFFVCFLKLYIRIIYRKIDKFLTKIKNVNNFFSINLTHVIRKYKYLCYKIQINFRIGIFPKTCLPSGRGAKSEKQHPN